MGLVMRQGYVLSPTKLVIEKQPKVGPAAVTGILFAIGFLIGRMTV